MVTSAQRTLDSFRRMLAESPDGVSLFLITTTFTNASLVHLKWLSDLERLFLGSSTKITDAGLEQLKELRKLKDLTLSGTEFTDAGLVHLRRLTNLRELDLIGTAITDAGLADLRKALPHCKISRR